MHGQPEHFDDRFQFDEARFTAFWAKFGVFVELFARTGFERLGIRRQTGGNVNPEAL